MDFRRVVRRKKQQQTTHENKNSCSHRFCGNRSRLHLRLHDNAKTNDAGNARSFDKADRTGKIHCSQRREDRNRKVHDGLPPFVKYGLFEIRDEAGGRHGSFPGARSRCSCRRQDGFHDRSKDVDISHSISPQGRVYDFCHRRSCQNKRLRIVPSGVGQHPTPEVFSGRTNRHL